MNSVDKFYYPERAEIAVCPRFDAVERFLNEPSGSSGGRRGESKERAGGWHKG
jgi:hypothetical protein